MTFTKNVIGETYSKMTIISDVPKTTANRRVIAKCSCGNTKEVLLGSLRNGRTTSCGCVQRETRMTHGKSKIKGGFYRAWASMLSRCADLTNEKYGGRGITVCPEWKSFEVFQIWALSTYISGMTLDRKDNSKGYSPDNCRWATKTTQSRNRRSGVNSSSRYIGVHWCKTTSKWGAMITVDGKKHNLGLHATELDAAVTREKYIINKELKDFTLNNVL